MKNKKILAIMEITMTAALTMTACSLGSTSNSTEQETETTQEVTETPEPEATETPEPTATIAANIQSTTYTSADGAIAINLPDATWSSKTDETDTYSFESPDQGKILILHGSGTDTMAATVVPNTQDLAVSLEQAVNDKVNGTDFEIQDYTSTDVNGIGVYSYTSKILNTDKSDDVLYIVHKVFANDTEYYNIEADVKTEDALASVKASVESFQILGDSTLAEAAPKKETTTSSDTESTDSSSTDTSTSTDASADSSASTDSSVSTDSSTSTDSNASTDSSTSTDSTSSTDSSSDSTTTNGGFTDEQLSNTDETRTIYRNSDGKATVIKPDGNGNWVDLDGNTYTFTGEQDAYSADGTSYYWHKEAGDVYYMPVE